MKIRILCLSLLAIGFFSCSKDRNVTDKTLATIKAFDPGFTPDSTFSIKWEKGFDIFTGPGYRYAPSIMYTPDSTLDIWTSAPGTVALDVVRFSNFNPRQNAFLFSESNNTISVQATPGGKDLQSVCDPGVIKYKDHYYMGYTSTMNYRGIDNHVFMCRSLSPTGPWEKWNGNGWGGMPEPVIEGPNNSTWGAGEPSMVVMGDSVFLYYSLHDAGNVTKLAKAPINDPNWPAKLVDYGVVIDKTKINAADQVDVKYCDSLKRFLAIHSAARFTRDSYLLIWQSENGINFKLAHYFKNGTAPFLHNAGWSGDEHGHMDISGTHYVGYGHGEQWGHWNLMVHPFKIIPTTRNNIRSAE